MNSVSKNSSNSSIDLETIKAPLRVDDPALAARIGEGLLALGYSGDAMREAVPESAEASTSMKMNHAAIAERLSTTTALACLLRAFLLRVATPEETMRQQVGEEFFALCDKAGLWTRVDDGGVVGTVVFLEDEGLFLLSDHTSVRRQEIEMYWVMSIGTSTMAVANSIAARPFPRVLDVCCGSGIQSFYLARRADQVVAIDRNPRALNYGRFGAAMNGYANIEFRESDCYSAVEGEEFDLIACNPPYVMTPDRQAYYRDGGMGGDRFSERILRETPAYLSDGGFANMTCDVGTMNGKTSEARLREWLAGNGCDVVALGGKKMSAAEYAQSWLKADQGVQVQTEFERWVAYFAELGVEEIQNWLVVLRRRSEGGPNWILQDTLPPTRKGHFGHQIARMFACQDVLRMSEAELWKAKLRLAPDMRLQQMVRPEGGRWMADSAKLTFIDGFIQEYDVEPRTAGLLILHDGTRTSEEVLARLAAEMGEDAEGMRAGWMGYLRHLIGSGILEPVEE
jgi:SAM-dependent methyltransferase